MLSGATGHDWPMKGPAMRSGRRNVLSHLQAHWVWLPIALFAGYCFAYLSKPAEVTLATTTDDAYYYLNFARNLVSGHGPTFDGIVETNGVQPLWTAMLMVLAVLIKGDFEYLAVMRLLSVCLCLASLFFLDRAMSLFLKAGVRVFVVLLFTVFLIHPVMSMGGMELALNLLSHTLALNFTLRLDRFEPRNLLLVGFLVSLTAMARVDNLALTPVYAAIVVWRFWSLRRPRADLLATLRVLLLATLRVLLLVATPSLAISSAYFSANVLLFDSALPISGEAKAQYPGSRPTEFGPKLKDSVVFGAVTLANIPNHYFRRPIKFSRKLALPIILTAGMVFAIVTFLVSRGRDPNLNLCFSALFLSLAVHLCAFSFHLSPWMAVHTHWYYAAEFILLLLVTGGLLETVARWNIYLSSVLGLIVLLLVGGDSIKDVRAFLETEPRMSIIQRMYRAAEWSDQNLPADAVIGGFDCGAFGYFTDSRVVNLDGLMNNRELFPYIRLEKPLLEYLQEKQVGWLMHIERRRKGAPSERIMARFPRECLEEVYRKKGNNPRVNLQDMVIYRVTCLDRNPTGSPP